MNRGVLRKKKFFNKFRFFVIPIILVVLIIFVLRGRIFTIKHIKVSDFSLSCATKELIALEFSEKDKNLLFYNGEVTIQRIKRKYFCIKDLKVKRIFPDALYIEVLGRKGVIILNLISDLKVPNQLGITEATASSEEAKVEFKWDIPASSGKFLVDEAGFIFAPLEHQNNLKEVVVAQSDLGLGKQVGNKLIETLLNIEKEVEGMGISIGKAIIFSGRLVLETDPKITFSLEKDYQKQLASLQLILQKAKMKQSFFPSEMKPSFFPGEVVSDHAPQEKDLKLIERIDLRFDKPIVVYSPEKK